jgi:3-hydroxyacyl-CoA dehydrogenase/enoyl-CoA hydratase/3-hydroxybutyryl-CoA epimerase
MNTNDYLTVEKEDGIATIWLDVKHEKMNVISPALMEILGKVFNDLNSDNNVKGVVITSAKKDFLAGADIKSFAIEKPGDFRPIQAKGLEMLEELEKGKKPVVAAIHGTGFGLGTELPLACHARIASNHPSTKMGLPEVKLGILPGGGGTQRLPRLVGIQTALDMMLTGKSIFAYRAKKMGLVDELTDKNKLHQAAVMMTKRLIDGTYKRKKRKKGFVNWFLEDTGIGRGILFKQARKMAMRQSQGNYPAIPAILDTVETGYKKGIKSGYDKELEYFEKLMLTPESKAMRGLFFNMSANKKNPISDDAPKLKTLGMIGAGFMGAGITEVSVNKGIKVLLKDIKDDMITAAKKAIWGSLKKKIRYKSLTKPQAEEVLGRVTGQLTYENFDKADIVIEAVLEKMDLKKIIISDIEKHCREDVIIASNTSSLSITEMAKHAKKPENVIGMHYFSPVPKMPLLEIVKTDQTADSVIASCYDFGIKQGKTCIVVKDAPGFYVNRILGPYMNECLVMIDEGLDFTVIDKALKKKGFPVGPITLFDQVGLDIAAHVVGSSEKMIGTRDGFKLSYGVVKMFEAGRLGRKNKSGFYNYDKNSKKQGPDKSAYQFFEGNGDKSLPLEDIQNRALMLMLNEAVLCLEEGIIANPTDGDIGAVFGIGFLPFTGGPFSYMDYLGASKVVEIMNDLVAKYGKKYTPAKTLIDFANNGGKFHA